MSNSYFDRDRTTYASRRGILRKISKEYQEMNGTQFKVLSSTPTPLEFSKLVHVGRPAVIKGLGIPAQHKWTDAYLRKLMGDRDISVSVTPHGHADAVIIGPDGRRYFAEPHTELMQMASFIDKLNKGATAEVVYMQSQNGNLFGQNFFNKVNAIDEDESEFAALREDVPSEIPWASEALDRSPDVVNLWIGDSRSVTSIHSDPYENIYTIVRGVKHFTLLPPTESWCLEERTYPHAMYTRQYPKGPLVLAPSPDTVHPVRWSSVRDPTQPGSLPPEARPIQITLHAGDTLYLPAGWWHHVRQTGMTIALNWWYDVEVRGMGWTWLSFLRGMGDEVRGGNDGSEDDV